MIGCTIRRCPQDPPPPIGGSCEFWDPYHKACRFTSTPTRPTDAPVRNCIPEVPAARPLDSTTPLCPPEIAGARGDHLPALAEAARARYEAGTELGLRLEPWTDPGRDFIREAAEELADACNYLEWAVRQGRGSDQDLMQMVIALDYVASAYAKLAALPARKSGPGVTPGGGE